MYQRLWLVILILALMSVVAPARTPATKDSVEQKRAEVRQMAKDTLARLYKAKPSAKQAVEKAVGYAVFSNVGMKILVAGGGKGKGIAISNSTKKETFMKMFEIQAGLGMGVKKFRLVWVFATQKAFDSFADAGWEFGGQATAAAKTADSGGAYQGAIAVADGVYLYQLTDKGLALELTVKGTKYGLDKDLN
jgi:lipid-binding SYLF domain-containing protein